MHSLPYDKFDADAMTRQEKHTNLQCKCKDEKADKRDLIPLNVDAFAEAERKR